MQGSWPVHIPTYTCFVLQDTCFVSNIGSSTPGTASNGRRLAQAPNPSSGALLPGGRIQRYDFRVPAADSAWDLGTGVIIVNNLPTNTDTGSFDSGNVSPGRELETTALKSFLLQPDVPAQGCDFGNSWCV